MTTRADPPSPSAADDAAPGARETPGTPSRPARPSFYRRLGWEPWIGPLAIRSEQGLDPTPDDECVLILRLPRTPDLDLTALLTAEWRPGEPW